MLIGSSEGIMKFNTVTREYDFSMPIDVYNCLTMVETNDEIVAGNFDSVIYRITKLGFSIIS